ncbi:hypothetical protein Taro_052811, partial [Colocasia esculenta]|nr:hypothetical protein [Colocasia esculenta]
MAPRTLLLLGVVMVALLFISFERTPSRISRAAEEKVTSTAATVAVVGGTKDTASRAARAAVVVEASANTDAVAAGLMESATAAAARAAAVAEATSLIYKACES